MTSKSKIILILESPEDSVMLRGILEREGLDAEFTGIIDPESAIPIIREISSDLILLDFHLPKSQAIDLLEFLKSDSELKKVPVIMLIEESYVGKSSQIMITEPQPDSYLLKPIHADLLLEKVRQFVPFERNVD